MSGLGERPRQRPAAQVLPPEPTGERVRLRVNGEYIAVTVTNRPPVYSFVARIDWFEV